MYAKERTKFEISNRLLTRMKVKKISETYLKGVDNKTWHGIMKVTIKLGKKYRRYLMNKEEILAKSRKENEMSDERSSLIKMKGAEFSIVVLIILWIAMMKFAPLEITGKLALSFVVNAVCFFNFMYQTVKNRTRTNIFFTAAFALTSIYYICRFLSETGIL